MSLNLLFGSKGIASDTITILLKSQHQDTNSSQVKSLKHSVGNLGMSLFQLRVTLRPHMVLTNEMRRSSSIYSRCNSRETRLQTSFANMSYNHVAGALHCCNNCRFNRLFIFSPSNSLFFRAAQCCHLLIFFTLTGLGFFYASKVLSSLTHPLQQHSPHLRFHSWVPIFICGPAHHHRQN